MLIYKTCLYSDDVAAGRRYIRSKIAPCFVYRPHFAGAFPVIEAGCRGSKAIIESLLYPSLRESHYVDDDLFVVEKTASKSIYLLARVVGRRMTFCESDAIPAIKTRKRRNDTVLLFICLSIRSYPHIDERALDHGVMGVFRHGGSDVMVPYQ
jgi:hypothetical protein